MLWDIMQMSHPLASRPHCSLPVIRRDYALLAVNASSANKFNMTIIIFRPVGTRWGQAVDRCRLVYSKLHSKLLQWLFGGSRCDMEMSSKGIMIKREFDQSHEKFIIKMFPFWKWVELAVPVKVFEQCREQLLSSVHKVNSKNLW